MDVDGLAEGRAGGRPWGRWGRGGVGKDQDTRSWSPPSKGTFFRLGGLAALGSRVVGNPSRPRQRLPMPSSMVGLAASPSAGPAAPGAEGTGRASSPAAARRAGLPRLLCPLV